MSEIPAPRVNWLQRVRTWRIHFANVIAGTNMVNTEPYDAVAILADQVLMLRCEVNMLVNVVMQAGLVVPEQVGPMMHEVAESFNSEVEQCFPGYATTEHGMGVKLAAASKNGHGPRLQ